MGPFHKNKGLVSTLSENYENYCEISCTAFVTSCENTDVLFNVPETC